MNLNKGQDLILNIVQNDAGLGKTAVMKIMFMLQQVKGVKTGYDFSIYTYGPYAPEVMEDIDEMVAERLLSCSMYPSHTYVGYKLNLLDKGEKAIVPLPEKEQRDLIDIVTFAREKSAKQLELYSTIIYVDNLYKKNSWNDDAKTIAKKVNEIKPHFSEETILDAHSHLREVKYI